MDFPSDKYHIRKRMVQNLNQIIFVVKLYMENQIHNLSDIIYDPWS